MSNEELDATIASLEKLAAWFEAFGAYRRSHDCLRLIDGLKGYREDILS
jgi:hypothetical protein